MSHVQPFLALNDAIWVQVKDGDPSGLSIFHRHYSYRPYADGRRPKLFVGPGEKMVLLTPCARALFVWRKFISGDGQEGVNCAVFRNERHSRLIAPRREPDKVARLRGASLRASFVDERIVRLMEDNMQAVGESPATGSHRGPVESRQPSSEYVEMACAGKRGFRSWRLAKKAAYRKRGREVYRCKSCGLLHVGSDFTDPPNVTRRFKRRRRRSKARANYT